MLVAYDGKSNYYSVKKLPFSDKTFELELELDGRKQEFTVQMRHTKDINMADIGKYLSGMQRENVTEHINALDTIIGAAPNPAEWVQRGRSFYSSRGA